MTDPASVQGRLAGLSREQRALLFEQIRRRKEGAAKPAGIPRRPPDREPPPLSFAQERLWLIDRLQPGLTAYNVPVALRISGDASPALLGAVLGAVVRRHEALRTTFREVAGRPVQVIAPAAAAADRRLPLVDLSALPAVERAAEARQLAGEEVRRPFDLRRGPLLRATLLRLVRAEQVLLLGMHHIVSDGWSMGVLVREITALYAAAVAGSPPPLPELPIQYADYAVWQRQRLQGEVLEAQLAYWRRRLAGVPGVLELPADRPRPAVPTYRGGRLEAVLDAGLTRELSLLARRHEASLFMVLLAGFQALLGRLTGQDDLAVGSPVANRHRTEVEPLIGFFVNTLVLRGELGGDPTFGELVERVRRGTLEAYEHQDLPFERLVEELRPERHLALNPLFQVSCAMQNAPVGRIELPGLAISPFELAVAAAQFDLDLNVWEAEGSLLALFGYSGELFDVATVRRLAGQLETLLRAAAAGAAGEGRRLSELPLLSAPERHQLLREWSAGKGGVERGGLGDRGDRGGRGWRSTAERVAAQAARTPGATAVAGRGGSLTYGDLDRRAAALAQRLRALGVGPEVPVALAMERAPEAIVALLAIWRAGGAYLPLDPANPAERLGFMLADSGARLLVADAAFAEAVRAWSTNGEGWGWEGEIVVLDPNEEPVPAASAPGAAPSPPLSGPTAEGPASMGSTPMGSASMGSTSMGSTPSPETLAYVLYTSGSTGRPKAVQVTHGGLSHVLASTWRELGFGPEDVFLAVASLSFDLAAAEIWLPLTTGARVVLATREEAADGRLLRARIEGSRVTVVMGTPATFRLLFAAGWPGGAGCKAICCGEAFPPDLAATLLARCGSVWNLYGPTEITICSTGGRVTSAAESLVPIGRPLGTIRHYVVDRQGREVPAGAHGELWIGGAGVARGYLGRPDLTAERFVPDPFAPLGAFEDMAAGERLYRSGDLVRFRPDGRLDCLGRIDGQVKLRGFRIELGEIESALVRQAGALQAAVAVRGEGDARRLVAWVVPRPEAAPLDTGEVRAALRRSLPEHMVPAMFVELEALPLTPSGKVDRRALPEPGGTPRTTAYAPPRDPVEEAVAAVWASLLEIEQVGVHDNFFALGGHSLLASRVIAAVRDAFGVELPLRTLFDRPTVAELSLALTAARSAADPAAPADRIPRLARDTDRFPVSASQLREWLLERLLPGAGAYNIPGGCRILGPLEAPHLALALREVAHRHESLRTTFAEPAGGGEPLQVIAADLELDVPLADLSALPAAAREEVVRELSRLVSAVSFDLARGPLLRVWLLRLAPREHLLLFTLHHIVSDGWSMGIFFRELAALYVGFAEGLGSSPSRRAPLPELPVQYADYAVWQRKRVASAAFGRQLDYWRRQLAGMPPLELPTDRSRPAVQRFAGARHPFVLSRQLTADLEGLARRRGASPFMVLLAAFAALLARYSGQEDFALGTFAGNRNRAELEGVIGFFINSLVLRLRPEGEASFARLVAQSREATLGAFAHQEVPFERLLEALHVERDLSRTPLFQVLLVFQNFPAAEVGVTDVRLEPVAVENDHSDFDLSLWASPGPEGIAGYFNYAVHLFDRETIARLGAHLEILIAGAVAEPELALHDLPLLSAAERKQLREWSAGSALPPTTPGSARVDALFTAQARRTPEAPAVEWEGGRLTYAELEERSEILATRLRLLGVGPEVLVGLAVERSPEMIVALLGVLKAGGAYLPLDPSYPKARLAWMIEDAALPLILTQASIAPTLPAGGARLLLLEESTVAAAEAGATLLVATSDESHAAYVIYTSGSTGRPKGVVVEHRSLAAYTRGAVAAFDLGPRDRVLQFASISFDASAEEIYPALASGATLVLRPAEMAASIAHFLRELERLRITVLDLPTAFWHELVAGLGTEGDLPAAVRLVILGGERALPERVALWRRRVRPGVRLLNTYGPTEATIVCTRLDLSDLSGGPEAAPIGRPIPGARVHLLDRWGGAVPVGVPGELHIGGAGLARGYLRRPEITAERFVPDPFAARDDLGGALGARDDLGGAPGARLYRTGDLARWLPSGLLEFVGRADHQVKLRGFRIEPGEIEAALRSHPALRDAAVVLSPGPAAGGDPRLVAYTVRAPAAEMPGSGEVEEVEKATVEGAASAELRAFLRERLPEFMVPSLFVDLPALPLTPAGKVDRRALPAPEALRPDRTSTYEAPRTALERTIAGIWRELLGVEAVGLHDNFFDLGAHSLLLVRAHARLREALGRELTVVDLFRHPSVGALAHHLSREEEKPSFQEVKTLAEQQKAALGRQRQAMERLRKAGGARSPSGRSGD
jgi:amino acid adenylation domain-containing protein